MVKINMFLKMQRWRTRSHCWSLRTLEQDVIKFTAPVGTHAGPLRPHDNDSTVQPLTQHGTIAKLGDQGMSDTDNNRL